MRFLGLLLWVLGLASSAWAAEPLRVGSKRFTESYVLAELATQVLQAAGQPAEHRQGLGNTAVVVQALRSGAIDLYPEYSGTIWRELLQREGAPPPLDELNRALAPLGLRAAVPLGFNNTYALALPAPRAEALGLRTVSDLARLGLPQQQALRTGLSHEFLVRADGWPGLRAAYGLQLQPGSGLDHGLAYQALAQGRVDLIDVYSTDAQIERLGLRVLVDDRGYFPRYDALLLMRAGVDPAPLQRALAGRIDATTMIRLNAAVELDGRSFAEAARDWIAQAPPAPGPARRDLWAQLFAPDLPRLLAQHGLLVGAAVGLALALGLPLGLWAARAPRLGAALLAVVGLLQTVPALALLALLIALFGRIGFVPALTALALYALLPIVANTEAALRGVPAGLRQAGTALGLRPAQLFWAVELPLALPVLLAGVRTAAVISVGGATLAAFVGAGGLGERIVAGLAVNDPHLLLAGALPAAALALAVQGVFVVVEKRLVRGRG